MKKRLFLLFLVMFALLASLSYSHEGEEEYMLDHSELYPITQWEAVTYGSAAFAILIAFILFFHKKMSDVIKRIVYLLVAVVVGAVTIYLITVTLHLNVTSVSKGPVHWHADFEIWACDKEIFLAKPQRFLSNKQGVDLLHAHQDNRIHVEGVLLDYRQASIGAFFHAVGGSLTYDGMQVPTDDGLMSFHDGDKCNEQPARLYVFVNGKLIQNPKEHVIAPYEKVPPGDRIKIVFTEKSLEEINPYVK